MNVAVILPVLNEEPALLEALFDEALRIRYAR